MTMEPSDGDLPREPEPGPSRVGASPRPGGRRVVDRRGGPIIVALGLALVSTPFAAVAIHSSSIPLEPGYCLQPACYPGRGPISIEMALLMALLAVTAAAVVGGGLGGALGATRPIGGLLVAVFVAWPVAIATLPILPTLTGVPYFGVDFCLPNCEPMIVAGVPLSGVSAYGWSLYLGLTGLVEVGALLALIAFAFARWRHRRIAAVIGLAAFVSLNLWSVIEALPAAAALIVGAVIWVVPFWRGQQAELVHL
jgi:hypothetical protein